MVASGDTPWEVWKKQEARTAASSLVLGAATNGLRPITVDPPPLSPERTKAAA
jgi:hypothetical protein